jgi:hypothetical protein
LRARNATKWATRREVTTPGPFGDITSLVRVLELIENRGVEGMIWYVHVHAAGMVRYHRPCEQEERLFFAFAGLVALWRKTWPQEMWPATLAGQFPPAPDDRLMTQALDAARVLVDQVLMPDSELHRIWESGPDQGVELREIVASLQKALA